MSRFCLPRDIYHGKGCLEELKNLKGKKAILVVGGGSMKRQGFLDKAVNYLKEGGMEVQLFEGVEPDPSVETVMKGAEAMRAFEPDWIVAMGGGSPIDAAKAMWAFYEYPEISFEDLITPFSFPELRQKAKFAAIPTTSGTATEVTAFSVITNYQTGVKYPLADFNITPDVAIVDPDLVAGLPVKQVAYTGMDALTHAIEGYTTKAAWEMTDMFHIKAIEIIGKSLRSAVANEKEGREGMALGQYIAGMGFSNVGLGIAHSMAHTLGAVYDTPHGVACAMMLPIVMEYNADCTGEKYREIARAMGVKGVDDMSVEEYRRAAVDAVQKLSVDVGIPTKLEALKEEDLQFLAESAHADACAPGNPKDASVEDLKELFRKLM